MQNIFYSPTRPIRATFENNPEDRALLKQHATEYGGWIQEDGEFLQWFSMGWPVQDRPANAVPWSTFPL